MHYFNDDQESKLLIEELPYKIITYYIQKRKPGKQKVYLYFLFVLELKEKFRDIYYIFMKYLYDAFSSVNSLTIISKNIFFVFVLML